MKTIKTCSAFSASVFSTLAVVIFSLFCFHANAATRDECINACDSKIDDATSACYSDSSSVHSLLYILTGGAKKCENRVEQMAQECYKSCPADDDSSHGEL